MNRSWETNDINAELQNEIVTHCVIHFKPTKHDENNAVTKILKENYSTNADDNYRDPVNTELAQLIREWVFNKQDPTEVKRIAKSQKPANLIINSEVYPTLDKWSVSYTRQIK